MLVALETELANRRLEFGPAYVDRIARAARLLDRSGVPLRAKRVGDPAPDFALEAPGGSVITLSHLLRSGPVVVSFLRGEWCAFCRADIGALLAAHPDFARLGATLVLITSEPPSDAFIAAVRALGGRAHLLRDPMLGVALQYGLMHLVPKTLREFYLGRDFDLSRDLSTGSWLLPLPADYVIDTEGIIQLSYVEPDFTKRLDPVVIVEALDRHRRP